MKSFKLGIALAVGLAAVMTYSSAQACGFKVVGAVGSLKMSSVNQTSTPMRIVMFRNPGSEVANQVLSRRLHSLLRNVGHKVEIIESSDQMASRLKSGGVDIVLSDLADLANLEQMAGDEGPVFIPVAATGDGAAQKYRMVLKPGSRESSYVNAINRMARRIKIGAV